jgi:hypothetical protein
MKKVLQEIIITHLASIVNKSFLKKLESISTAILSMRGRITMLGISRWNERYSYKTIERFFSKKIDWLRYCIIEYLFYPKLTIILII